MRIFLATLVTALLWISLMPVDAQTIYPTQRCRVYYDTEFIFRVSAERSCLFTHANCLCERQGSLCITITRIVADIDLPHCDSQSRHPVPSPVTSTASARRRWLLL